MLLDYDKHKQLQTYVKTLNQFYKDTPAFWQVDTAGRASSGSSRRLPAERGGFPAQGRGGQADHGRLQLHPRAAGRYIMGAPVSGTYKEILNSDDAAFGGSGQYHNKSVRSKKVPMHGFDQSITLTLPPLSTIYFEVPAPRAPRSAKTTKTAKAAAEKGTAAKKTTKTTKAAGRKKTTAAKRTTKSKVEKGAPAKEPKAEKKPAAKRTRKPKADKAAEE